MTVETIFLFKNFPQKPTSWNGIINKNTDKIISELPSISGVNIHRESSWFDGS